MGREYTALRDGASRLNSLNCGDRRHSNLLRTGDDSRSLLGDLDVYAECGDGSRPLFRKGLLSFENRGDLDLLGPLGGLLRTSRGGENLLGGERGLLIYPGPILSLPRNGGVLERRRYMSGERLRNLPRFEGTHVSAVGREGDLFRGGERGLGRSKGRSEGR